MEELLGKYFSGEASEEETSQVLEWRAAREENARAFFETRKAWLAAESISAPDKELLKSIIYEPAEHEIKIVPLWNQKIFQLAAAVLLVLGAVLILLQVVSSPPYGEVVTEVTTFDLPDGSEVTLQRGASITIDNFDRMRIVHLTGKAFFDVKPKAGKPFRVVTEGASIEVLGTSFMVDNAEELGYTEVLVATGEVSFSQNPEKFDGKFMKVLLKEGEMGKLIIGTKGIQKQRIKDDNYLSWKTKTLTFRKTALKDVAEKLYDVYGVHLEFRDPALSQCSLTAKFHRKKPEQVVDIIARTFGFTYEKSQKTFVLSGEGCR